MTVESRSFAAPRPRRALAWLRPVVGFGLWPNLLFWVVGQRLYLMRPLINVDYLLIGALAAVLPRRLVWFGLGLQFALDAGVNVAPALHFQLADLEHELGDAVHLHWLELLPLTVALVAACAAAGLVAQALAGRSGRGPSLQLLALTALVCAVDVCNGTSFLPLPVSRSFLDLNVANSVSAKVLMAWKVSASHQGAGSYEPLEASQSATGPLLARIRDRSQPLPPIQFGIVTVESLGRLLDDDAMAQLLSPLTSDAIRARYEVEVGAVPFHGVTLDGEFRELCGVRLGWRGRSVPDCLPAALARRGYQTVSLHGFTRAFYDRSVWYPQVGFGRSRFAEELRADGLDRTCGSGFSGLCDDDVAAQIARELEQGTPAAPRLVYWMTLNSHLPLRDEDARGSTFDCARHAVTRDDDVLCLQTQVLSRALQAVARVALDPALPATAFVVVGDHAPPFLTRSRRAQISDTQVPFVRLTPRPR